MDSQEEPESQPQSQPQTNVRLKKDITWKYVIIGEDEGKRIFTCTFCNKIFRGGGINRLKQHLGGIKGNAAACLSVPADVRFLMKTNFEESSQKSKEVRRDGLNTGQAQEAGSPSVSLGKRKVSSSSDNAQSYFSTGIHDASQPSIKSVWQSKERLHDTDLAVAMWLYHACIPMNAVNSPLFPIAMSKIATMGHGYKGPSYHAVRVNLLKDAKQSVKLIVDSYREHWSESGCTIMSDGWRDARQRPLINFLVYCSKGISFIKSVDASDIESNAENLCNLFSEIVEIVGYENVVHLVTDNAANYKAAGGRLCAKYPLICWSPCATHCINLILKDVSEIPEVSNLIQLASRITVFIYNHKWPLNWLRKRPGWTEIIRPGATRFGTSFIALKSLYDHKSDLQALVTSNEYKKLLKMPKARDVRQTVLDSRFWQNCLITVKVMGPILRLLRVCDSDEKPSLGYVYEGMLRVRSGIKELFQKKKRLYKTYVDIVDARWDKMLRKSLHAAAYWLNPVFQYEKDNNAMKQEAFVGVLDMIEKMTNVDPQREISISQLTKFRDKVGGFGRPYCLSSVKNTRPDEWWKAFGGEVPELQSFAVRILSQTASSSGCERNWSVFERVHTKRRNRLEHERLSDLVYVHYNLRLQNRLDENKRAYDPVDYQSIDKTEFWVVEEEAEGELNFDELENMIDEEPPVNFNPSTSQTQTPGEDEVVQLDDDDDIDFDDGDLDDDLEA